MMHGPLWSPARHEGPPPRQSVSVAWTLAFGQPEDRTPTHGYAATREAAMAVIF